MKNLKTALIPVAVLLFGIGSAFATNKAKTDKNASILAYHYDASAPLEKCIRVSEVDCDVTGTVVCEEVVNGSLKVMQTKISDTECGQALFRN